MNLAIATLCLLGDLNGDCHTNVGDVLLAIEYASQKDPAGDLNGDGLSNILDAQRAVLSSLACANHDACLVCGDLEVGQWAPVGGDWSVGIVTLSPPWAVVSVQWGAAPAIPVWMSEGEYATTGTIGAPPVWVHLQHVDEQGAFVCASVLAEKIIPFP